MTTPELGVLLDLDQTLVLTQAIEPLRRARQWARVYRSFDQTHVVPGTSAFIDEVTRYAKVGVVTNSPRLYAERLLAYHRLKIPVLVGYHDVRLHKPHPDSILKSASLLQIPVERCIHVGDSAIDIEASIRAGAIAVAVNWGEHDVPASRQAKLIAMTWDSVLNFVRAAAALHSRS